MSPENLPWIVAAVATAVSIVALLSVLVARRRRYDPVEDAPDPELVRRISRRLDRLEEIGAVVDGLDRAFRVPRVRGGFGETLLEELLRSWLPEGSWSMQYAFADGSRADAVIRMGSRLVAVDAKFPVERLEAWLVSEGNTVPAEVKRLFTGYAQDIAGKYVRPDQGTLAFALMYIPAEAIHYRLLRDDNGEVIRKCLRFGVLPVGPTSLFAYLQTVSYGLRGLRLPREGRELRRRIDRLRREATSIAKPLATAGTHLKNLVKSWEEVDRRWGRLEESIEALEKDEEKT